MFFRRFHGPFRHFDISIRRFDDSLRRFGGSFRRLIVLPSFPWSFPSLRHFYQSL
ncbi:hypothetical protein [Lysinibacillus sp. G4S2]|uniref:hypothetical protein n=1 Tax=Lysinibacillus sp. G4S2 TaxID=3055859 RepID=UPI0025A2FBE8|nr:hypothetical protein [Lysinibacillus sp. G4S2]MDM5248241.1 hypothetical protein [Lysinibacillus sp. G4S2]